MLVLCGRSPRHLYVANALCQAADVLAIVQETGSEFSWKKLARTLRPDNFLRKAWRWLRDRRRYTGSGEARFFFGDRAPRLDRPELVREVPHINHPEVLQLARELQPDLIAVFGTSLHARRTAEAGPAGHRQPARRPVARVPRRRLHLLGALQRRAARRWAARCTGSMPASTPAA